MLPKVNRLKNTKDIETVFGVGRGLKDGFLFLKSAKNSLGVSRFTFIVSRKVDKKASRRNKIKRSLREAVKILLPHTGTGFDAVIAAQKGIENKNFQEIKENIEKLFKKANLL